MSDEVVIFTNDPEREVVEVQARARKDAARRIFVYGTGCDVSTQRALLPDWQFVVFEESMQNQWVMTENTEQDVFVLHHCRPSKIPDRNLGMYQTRAVGQKLVVEDHPFCGKAEPWYLYFPYSYVDKTLLGYPHCYAFRDAKTTDPYNPETLAKKVAAKSVVHLDRVFTGIQRIDVALTVAEHESYQSLKRSLFETEATPKAIIRSLHKYVTTTASYRASRTKSLPLLDLNKLWPQYQAGTRKVVVTDSKVDLYLYSQLECYISRANSFIAGLHRG